MKTLLKLAAKHGRNAVSEALYIKYGIDRTRPVFFYALSTERCNLNCRTCGNWRQPASDSPELSIGEWQSALLNIRDFVGEYSISFSGGEPLVKKGFLDLVEFAGRNSIHAGFTTNGLALSRQVAKRIAEVSPFNVNISVDGPDAGIHDYLRDRPGLFDKITEGIASLAEERTAHKAKFPIVIKSTINAVNFEVLPEIVNWAIKAGATAVNLQPVIDWNWPPEIHEELWIKPIQFARLNRVIEQLKQMKSGGAPILNTRESLDLVIPHFRGDSGPKEYLPCRVGLGYMYIDAIGDVKICPHFPAIGNIRTQKARDIWYGARGSEIRRQTVACEKLCLLTCVSNKSLKDKARMGMKLMNPLGKTGSSRENKGQKKTAAA